MELSQITSAIINDVYSGLAGMNANINISFDQIEDEVIAKRQVVIREMYNKGLLKAEDLMVSINCIEVDCADPVKCCAESSGKTALHFEIPQLMEGIGADALKFVGSADRSVSYDVYFDKSTTNSHKYKRRGADSPYVYIERTPNENQMYDGWIYNLPFVKKISVIGIFKDLRQLEELNCCNTPDFLDFGIVSDEVRARITKEKLQYYRQNLAQPQPNNLTPR